MDRSYEIHSTLQTGKSTGRAGLLVKPARSFSGGLTLELPGLDGPCQLYVGIYFALCFPTVVSHRPTFSAVKGIALGSYLLNVVETPISWGHPLICARIQASFLSLTYCGPAYCFFHKGLKFGYWLAQSNNADGLPELDRWRIMIISIVDIKASSETREELRRGLSSLLGPTEAEAGCTGCQCFEKVPDSNGLRLESYWKTQSDLFRHIRSATYKKLLFLMELSAVPPTVQFFTVSEELGFDLIVAARNRL